MIGEPEASLPRYLISTSDGDVVAAPAVCEVVNENVLRQLLRRTLTEMVLDEHVEGRDELRAEAVSLGGEWRADDGAEIHGRVAVMSQYSDKRSEPDVLENIRR